MVTKLSGAVALVTGASSGIGEATAELLAAAGARLVLAGRHEARLTQLARRLRGTALVGDLADPGGAADLAERASAISPHFDILVSSAGLGWAGTLADMAERDITKLVTLNLTAPMLLTRSLLPGMLARSSGHLCYVSSIAGRLGVRDEAVYAATKGGLDIFAESLRMELAGTGIAVSVLVPAIVDTRFFDRRGRPIPRRAPRPASATAAATALVSAIARGRNDIYLPGWMRVPVAMRSTMPKTYRRLAGRFG